MANYLGETVVENEHLSPTEYAMMVVVQSYRNAERSLSKTQMFLREANDSVQSLKRRTDDRNAQRGGTK